ncbi:phosphotransferase family protein [Streptomyces sp. DSM 15324]|uniref:phosphotransferase family protein n=1 Tax=Streptomyces sp. DSM 15324 TaxID=1739111 RepID=UPI000748A507|nr:aminoglycoside phosphotransferase family protein [Streptomyces sp. DSM 15324]KUO10536.1 phosphotransferase enzyme family protein [Streptomyces sp. DSM 15324]
MADPSAALRTFVEKAESEKVSSGHHNLNYVVEVTDDVAGLLGRKAGTRVTVRIRRADALRVVIRTWQDEPAILEAVGSVFEDAPLCLARRPDFAIHSHVEGVPLSTVCGNGKPVDTLLVKAMAELLARMSRVRPPALPAEWPAQHNGSQAFLRWLVRLADEQIRVPNWDEYGGLFIALGIREDALLALADRIPPMTRRPYSLLHADLHRDNLIIPYDGSPPLVCVDWELATYGDPLHDLATHLVRMQYPPHQWAEVIDAWVEAMRVMRPTAVRGIANDLRHYLDFERAQSVYPDVIRAARSLQDAFTQKRLDLATAEVSRALGAAKEPLGLDDVPKKKEIERALCRWLMSRGGGIKAGEWIAPAYHWDPDPDFPEPSDFPASDVHEALLAEGGAPASRVFKGAAHLNTVVRMPGNREPVVVRRILPDVCRREPVYLKEHVVLRAIHASNAKVAAPRVLALGTSYKDDRFAVHTYVGSADRPWPSHPVDGLLPHEADALVDQLCELTKVDTGTVGWNAGGLDFHEWLKRQLVALVRDLPKETLQLARALGLPDHVRLGEILSGRQMTRRPSVLLHGDLNPWNLVRRDDELVLTVIDWEMALVGDPLYDLVRHMHLTPTRPEIRKRMFWRWKTRLPEEYTVDCRRDARVYGHLEVVRSAYVDLDRLVTRASLDAPNVRRAVDSYDATLSAAMAALGLPVPHTSNPYLARALARRRR